MMRWLFISDHLIPQLMLPQAGKPSLGDLMRWLCRQIPATRFSENWENYFSLKRIAKPAVFGTNCRSRLVCGGF